MIKLDNIGDLSGLLNDPEKNSTSAGPMEINLDLIDEDPNQPRTNDNPGFSKASLEELASTIHYRGVKTPISIRENHEKPGRFIINHGARRFRASRIANKDTIPAFIDNDYNEVDQVIENLQRNELTAREIADYIGRELAKGAKKSYIASTIGKSAAFVSQHVTLLDLPEPIATAFNSGRVNDVTVINELVKAYKNSPDQVVIWLNDDEQEITRGSVKLLREYLNDKINSDINEHNLDTKINSDNNDTDSIVQEQRCIDDAFIGQIDIESDNKLNEAQPKTNKKPNTNKSTKTVVMIKHNERMGHLMLNKRPLIDGWAWIKYEDDGDELEVELETVKLIALVEES